MLHDYHDLDGLPIAWDCIKGIFHRTYIYIFLCCPDQVMLLRTLTWNSALIDKSFIKICITQANRWPVAGYVTFRTSRNNADN